MRLRYDFSSYDEHLCLKPPMLLWFVLLYLSRAVLMPLVIGAGSMLAMSADATTLLKGIFSPYTLVPSALAAVVLFSLIRRSPSASAPVRWIWSRGRIFLASAAILDCALTVAHSSLRHGELGDQDGMSALIGAALDLYFLVYILAARQVRDAFADFPIPLEPAQK